MRKNKKPIAWFLPDSINFTCEEKENLKNDLLKMNTFQDLRKIMVKLNKPITLRLKGVPPFIAVCNPNDYKWN